jgi:hypothetical protein
VPYYKVWVFHDESATQAIEEEDDYMRCFEAIQLLFSEDPLTMEVESFIKLLKASEEPLHEHTKVTLLTFMT